MPIRDSNLPDPFLLDQVRLIETVYQREKDLPLVHIARLSQALQEQLSERDDISEGLRRCGSAEAHRTEVGCHMAPLRRSDTEVMDEVRAPRDVTI